MKRRYVLLSLLAAPLLSVVFYLGWRSYVRSSMPGVLTNKLVGQSESQIRDKYGQPRTEWQRYEPLAGKVPGSIPIGPIRTLIFKPVGLLHPEGGTLWVWLKLSDGNWICFESCWYADNVRF